MRNCPNKAIETLGILQGEIRYGILWSEQNVPDDGETAQPWSGRRGFGKY